MKRNCLILLGFLITSFILLSCEKDMIEQEQSADSSYLDGAMTRQARRNFIVTDEYRYDIKVFLDTNVPDSWVNATLSAISSWNSFHGLSFRRVTSAPYDIRISMGVVSGGSAQATWPSSNGKPGSDIIINSGDTEVISSQQKTTSVLVAIGHNLGIVDTDWMTNHGNVFDDPGIGIPGTPNTGRNPDPNSIFNARALINGIHTFSYYDKIAINILFPFIWIDNSITHLCPNQTGTVSISSSSYIPAGARIQWFCEENTFENRSIDGRTESLKNISFEEKKAKVRAILILPNGQIKGPRETEVHVHGSQWSAAKIITYDYLDFSLSTDGYPEHAQYARDYYWESSRGDVHVQRYNWTYIDGVRDNGTFTVSVKFTDRCGNIVRTQETFY